MPNDSNWSSGKKYFCCNNFSKISKISPPGSLTYLHIIINCENPFTFYPIILLPLLSSIKFFEHYPLCENPFTFILLLPLPWSNEIKCGLKLVAYIFKLIVWSYCEVYFILLLFILFYFFLLKFIYFILETSPRYWIFSPSFEKHFEERSCNWWRLLHKFWSGFITQTFRSATGWIFH